jgi:DNA processing protein
MAFGIDRCAHDYALHHGGITQGFAAHGLDQCYPSAHYTLMDQISKNGAIISPFPVGTPPYKANFLKRNALLALCSDEVIVIEAGEKSGALNTAACAIQCGKPLWVMKGHPTSKHCGGNRKLLSEGAKIYPMNEEIGLRIDGKDPGGHFEDSDASKFELEIIEHLKHCPRTTEQLIEICSMDRLALQSTLLTLEKSRYVAFRPTGFWHYEGW